MAQRRSEAAVGQREHGLFGLTLTSDFAFESRLAPARGAADLVFSSSGRAPLAAQPGAPLYESPLLDQAGESVSRLYRLPDGELLRFGHGLDFYLGERRIDCHLRHPSAGHLVEIRLLGPVLAYWLERLAICVLHASAVVIGGLAIAFMATNQGGKSALAATLMDRGAPLLTDDLLPIELRRGGLVARSAYPQMRMWPDGLAHFIADRHVRAATPVRFGKHWVPVGPGGFGSFQAAAAPFGCIYLPERQDSGTSVAEVGISPVSPRQAVIEMLRCSFSPYIVEAVGLQPSRLDLFARLVQEVPVRRLVYPSGFDELSRVSEAVLADLEA